LWLRAADQRPQDPELVNRGFEYAVRTAHARARRLRFQEAADLFTRATALKPNDPELLFYVAALRLALDQPEAHRDASMKLLAYSMTSDQPQFIERAAKAMLLDPNVRPGPELYAAEQAARSVKIGGSHSLAPWFYLVEGMAHYRGGKFDRAMQTLTASRDGLKDYAPGRVLAEFYIAMAQHRSGDNASARATLAEATRFMPGGLDVDPNADWDIVWIDWLDASIAQREATRLILGPPSDTQALPK
jgi:tetratricopeptide (TPR) repeat protein